MNQTLDELQISELWAASILPSVSKLQKQQEEVIQNLPQKILSFCDIPISIQVEIFAFLTNLMDVINCCYVCQSWRKILYSIQHKQLLPAIQSFFGFHPISSDKKITLSSSSLNIKYNNSSGKWQSYRSNTLLSSGIWYWEVRIEKFVDYKSNAWLIGIGILPENGKDCNDCLGDNFSYICGTGKVITTCDSEGSSYASTYGLGSTVGVYLDLDKKCLAFTLNGKNLGIAFGIKNLSRFKRYYPYVAVASCEVEISIHFDLAQLINFRNTKNFLTSTNYLHHTSTQSDESYENSNTSSPHDERRSSGSSTPSQSSNSKVQSKMIVKELLRDEEKESIEELEEEDEENIYLGEEDEESEGFKFNLKDSAEVSHELAGAWKIFFKACGIGEPACLSYAKTFSNHDLELDMIPKLSDTDLENLGVKSLGHRLRIRQGSENTMAPPLLPKYIPPQSSRPSSPTNSEDSLISLTPELAEALLGREEELENIAYSYRNHCIYLLALVKFCDSYLKRSTTPSELSEIRKKLFTIEQYLNDNRIFKESRSRSRSVDKGKTYVDSNEKENTHTQRVDRSPILKNLIETETTFVKNLNLIILRFVRPINKIYTSLGLVAPQDILDIFAILEKIFPIHEDIVSRFRDELENPPAEQQIGLCFNIIMNHFDAYLSYCVNLEKSLQAIPELKKRKAIKMFFEDSLKDPQFQNISFEKYLEMPLNHLKFYSKIIQDLIKSTNQDHIDYHDLVSLNKQFSSFFTKLEQAKKNPSSTPVSIEDEITQNIFSKLVWTNEKHLNEFNEKRKFLFETKVKKLTSKFLWVQRELLFFNDMVVLVERKGKKLFVKLATSYNNCKFETSTDTNGQKFCLVFTRIKPEEKVTLSFNSFEVCDYAMKLTQECLLALPSVVPFKNLQEREAWENLVKKANIESI